MHMGTLPISGSLKPANLVHIILNNGAHDSVGGQPTVALDIDILSMARAAGYTDVFLAETRQELHSTLLELKRSVGPRLLRSAFDAGRERISVAPTGERRMDFMR